MPLGSSPVPASPQTWSRRDGQVTISFVNRPIRVLLSLAATSCGLIPFESSPPASAATAHAALGPAASEPAPLIERSPLVDPITEPLEFTFALFDAVLGN
jgi:hypothetical protein